MYIQTMNIDISTKTLLWNYPKTWWSHPILEWNIWMSQNWHLKIQILISEDVCFALIATFLEVPLTYIWMNFFRSNRLSHGASKCRKLSGLVLSLGLACVAPKCCPPLGHLSGCPPHIFEETHPEFQLPFLGKHTKIFRKKFVFEIRGTYATLQNGTILFVFVHCSDAYIKFQLGYLWVLNTFLMVLKRRPVCTNWCTVWHTHVLV